jgi:hypothetical protein
VYVNLKTGCGYIIRLYFISKNRIREDQLTM